MRPFLLLLLAGCAGNPAPSTDSAPPIERIVATPERIVAAFTAANVPILSRDASVVTTAPLDRLTMRAGGETGSVEWFVRGTSDALTLWARTVTRDGSRERPAETGRCAEVPSCAKALATMRAVAATLR